MNDTPLVTAFPGIAALPRIGLVAAPTPLEDTVTLLPADLRERLSGLWVKRDDLTSPRYGGNKVRKLEFLLGEALEQDRRAVITFGAYGSNHALATAVHARALGLEPHVVLSPQDPGPFAAGTLLAHARLKTVIHPVEGWDGRREAVLVKQELQARDGVEPYVIPMGGTCALGAVGYVNAAFEVVEQIAEATDIIETCDGEIEASFRGSATPDVVYVAAGTLGTAVGLAVGFAAAAPRAGLRVPRVVAVRVTPESICNLEIAKKLAGDTVELLRGLAPDFPELGWSDLAFTLRDDWFEPGYGIVTPETRAAVDRAAAAGIKLETTYSGKALAALAADAKTGALDGKVALLWDTYSSAEKPAAGPLEALPEVLRDYIAECRRGFPESA